MNPRNFSDAPFQLFVSTCIFMLPHLPLWLEINQLEHEIENHIHNLEAWMQPEAVGTDLINTIGGGKSVTPPQL